jgi:hypothetical protein
MMFSFNFFKVMWGCCRKSSALRLGGVGGSALFRTVQLIKVPTTTKKMFKFNSKFQKEILR